MNRIENPDQVINRFNNFADLLYPFTINPESENNIKKAQEFLKYNPQHSIIYYFNHISLEDPYFARHIAHLIDPNHTRPLIAPMSYSHTDSNHLIGKITHSLVNKIAPDVEAIPIIQKYQIDNQKYGYSDQFARKINSKFFKRIIQLKESNVPFGLLIAPEGTRSKTGKLQLADSGILSLTKRFDNLVLLPIGISYNNKQYRGFPNFFKEVYLTVGELIQSNSSKRLNLDDIMNGVSAILPESMRGVYSKNR